MTTFVLLHGSGEGGWHWWLVVRALRGRGHVAVAPDLATDRDDATWEQCADEAAEAVGGARDVVVVGHSAGGLLVPLVAARLAAVRAVYVAGMVPQPGEDAYAWFDALGWSEAVAEQFRLDGLTGTPDPAVAFHHDVEDGLAAAALQHERPTSDALAQRPWPDAEVLAVPSSYVVTTRDRFLPPSVQRRVAAERLGIASPLEIETGHCPHLSRPEELARLLEELATPVATGPRPAPEGHVS